jgi:hemoglobin
MTEASIYEYVGGAPAFQALAHALHERCVADPVLNHPFDRPGLRPDHLDRLASYLGEVFGGPKLYTERFGGESAMQAAHAGNGMHPEMGERFVTCFVQALDDAGFPEDPRLRESMRAFMESAVAGMDAYNAPGSVVPEGLSVPRWPVI